jgi:NhaP-type Na+/H+ or K+/H+ antiporter
MSLEEFEEHTDQKTKRYILTKSIMDLGMGLIYIAIGIMILFAKKIGLTNQFVESTMGKIFAGLIMLYGLWRLYRGVKKDYLNER